MIARRLLWFIAKTLLSVLLLPGFHLRGIGMARVPAHGGVVLALNHQSYFDPALLACTMTRMLTFMARDTLFRHRIGGALLRGFNTFPVRLGVADTTAMREAVRRLKQGWCLVVFPEGTRTQDGSIGRLKPGVLMIAERAGVPIVPAVVEGAFEAWPRSGGMRRHPISVWYGRPISAAQRSNMSRQEFAEALRAEMLKGQALLKKMRSRVR